MTMPPIPPEGNPAEYLTKVRMLENEVAHCTHILAALVNKYGGKITISREDMSDQDKMLHVHSDGETQTITLELKEVTDDEGDHNCLGGA